MTTSSNGFNLNGPLTTYSGYKPITPTTPQNFKPTPVSSALNTVQKSPTLPTTGQFAGVKPLSVTNPVVGAFGTQNQQGAGITTSGLLGGANPQTLSRQEIKPDGTQIKETYTDPNKQKENIQNQITSLKNQIPAQQAIEDKAKADKAQADKVSYSGLVGQGQEIAQGNRAIGQKSADIQSQYAKQFADVGQRAAGYGSSGTSPVAFGNEAVVKQTGAAQQQALAQAGQMALQGTGQELTAQNQAQSGINTLAGLTPELLRYGKNTDGSQMTAEQAKQFEAQMGATGSFATKYLEGQKNLQIADSIQNQIVSTLQANPTLNSTPLSAISNLKELISGQISSGPQQLLSQQINSYIQQLGLDPAAVVNIAHQQTGTLAQLLDSLRQTAQQQVDVYKNGGNLGATSGGISTPTGSTIKTKYGDINPNL